MKKALCLTATLALFGCGAQNLPQEDASSLASDHAAIFDRGADAVTPRVIGGAIPKDGTLQSVALLLSEADVSIAGGAAQTRQLSICTGTLISPTTILSAAHCVNDTLLKTAIARAVGPDGRPLNAKIVGDLRFRVAFVRSIAELKEKPELALEVDSVLEHEDFALLKRPWAALQKNPGRWDDVSIVRLAKPVTDRKVQKLATTSQVSAQAGDASLTRQFAGYGVSDESDPKSAGVLKEGAAHLGEIGSTEFIAGADDEQVACHGDSGGPIFLDGSDSYQIGIASRINKKVGLGDLWGGITGNVKAPSCELGLVYTRVDAYLPWIRKHVPDLGQPAS